MGRPTSSCRCNFPIAWLWLTARSRALPAQISFRRCCRSTARSTHALSFASGSLPTTPVGFETGSTTRRLDCDGRAARRLPRSVLARSIASWGYPAAYVVVLLSFTLIWFRHFPFLYIGRDAALSLWLGKAYLDWAHPFDVTAMNPLQGMTSMLMAINPYFNPAVWIFQTGVPQISKEVVSFIVYFIKANVSTLPPVV